MSRIWAGVTCATVCVVAVLSGQSPAQPPAAPQQTQTTNEAYTRDRANGDASLLFSFANAGKVAEVRAELPSDRDLVAGYLPPGWTHEKRGRRLVASGPPVDEANLRFDMRPGSGREFAGKQTRIEARGPAGAVTVTLAIGELEKVAATPNLEGILTLPPSAVPGQPFLIGAPDLYRKGEWHFVTGGGALPILPIDRLKTADLSSLPDAFRALATRDDVLAILDKPSPRPLISVFPENGAITGVRFVDRWGELVVDAPVAMVSIPATTCTPSVTGAAQFAFAGQAACVSGCFPDLRTAYTLLLDDTTTLTPWAASPASVMVGIPADTKPGARRVTTATGTGTATVGVLGLDGSIDQNELWRGQSTQMRLRILGTDEPLPLAVLNRTPGVITVEGGVHQVTPSSGGADNVVVRSVRGIRRGNFTITYALNVAGCGTS